MEGAPPDLAGLLALAAGDEPVLEGEAGGQRKRNDMVARAARARAAKKMRKLERDRAEAVVVAKSARAQVALVGEFLPEAVAACGLPVARVRGSVAPTSFAGIAMVAFRTFGRVHSVFGAGFADKVKRAGATLVDLASDWQRRAFRELLVQCRRLKDEGAIVCLTVSHEHDETRQYVKASLGELIAKSLKVPGLSCKHPVASQRSTPAKTFVQSGRVLVRVKVPSGIECVIEQSWISPPFIIDGATAEHIVAALRKGMCFRPDDPDEVERVVSSVTSAVLVSRGDRASANLAAFSHFRACSGAGGDRPSFMFDEEYCQLHNLTGLKASSTSVVSWIGKFFTLASLISNSDFSRKLVVNVVAFVKTHFRRHTGVAPPSGLTERNRKTLDLLFDFGSPHHRRIRKDGTIGQSRFLQDLERLMRLDNGDWRANRIDHYCFDPETGKPCHETTEAAIEDIVVAYVSVLVGKSWPIPTVSRFTNIQQCVSMGLLGCALHGLLAHIVPAPRTRPEGNDRQPDLDECGAQDTDFAIVQGIRERKVYKAFVEDKLAPAKIAIFAQCLLILDGLTYDFLEGNGEKMTLHRLVARDGSSIIAVAQDRLCKLLSAYRDPQSDAWFVLDAVCSHRSTCMPDLQAYVRGMLLTYSAGVHRRLEIPFMAAPYCLHYMVCDECSPSAEAKRQVMDTFIAARECDLNGFARDLRKRWPTQADLSSQSCSLTIRAWQDALRFTSRRSECMHARHRRILSTLRKSTHKLTFIRAAFLAELADVHRQSGGSLGDKRRDWVAECSHEAPTPLEDAVGQLWPQKVRESLPALTNEGVEADEAAMLVQHQPPSRPRPHCSLGPQSSRAGVGGNPYMHAVNQRMHAAKRLSGAAKLTDEERNSIRAVVRKELEDPAVYRVAREEWEIARSRSAGDATDQHDSTPFTPWWGLSTRAAPISPQVGAQHVSVARGWASKDKTWHSTEFDVHPAAEVRQGAPHLGCISRSSPAKRFDKTARKHF